MPSFLDTMNKIKTEEPGKVCHTLLVKKMTEIKVWYIGLPPYIFIVQYLSLWIFL